MIYDKKIFQKLGNLLVETIPVWEEVTFHFDKRRNYSEWSAYYIQSSFDRESAKKKQLEITPKILGNLRDLEESPIFQKLPCDVVFFRSGQYKIRPSKKTVPVALPDSNQIRSSIKNIQNLDLLTVNIDIIKEHIGLLSNAYIVGSPIIAKRSKLFRGVIWDEKPKNVAQVSYPPKDSVKNLHRAGRKGESLFYCSTAREAPFWELGVKAGDSLVISHWETREPLVVNNVGYHSDVFSNLNSDRTCPNWWHNNELVESLSANELIKAFFSQEFAKKIIDGQEHLYKISIAIAEHHFQQNIFSGLLYPTLAMKANADNLVLKPEVVDSYLKLTKVEYILVEEVFENAHFNVKILDFANSFDSNGLIQWKGRLPQWVLREKGEILKFSVENNQWVARNEIGEILEPE